MQVKTKVILLFLWGITLYFDPTSVLSQDTSSDAHIIPKILTRMRPDHDGKPVQVEVGIFIIDVINVDEVTESFEADFLLNLKWQDPRLSANALGLSLEDYRLSLSDIWHPSIHPINQRDLTKEQDRDVDIDPEGTVRFSERIYGEFSSPLELDEFPFDVQHLKIQLASFEYSPEDVIFIMDSAKTGRVDDILVGGWDIIKNSSDVDVNTMSGVAGAHTRLVHTIVISRHVGYYVWKFIVPLCLIILMAWSVFWLDPKIFVVSQIGVATASVFALIAFLLSLRQMLPRVSYLTRADELVLGATILVFLSMAEVIVTSRLAQKEKINLARKIDKVSRWVYLLFFTILLSSSLFL
jgi:hypothetical protein